MIIPSLSTMNLRSFQGLHLTTWMTSTLAKPSRFGECPGDGSGYSHYLKARKDEAQLDA